jgi:hypothetical protein
MKTAILYKWLILFFFVPIMVTATENHEKWKGRHTKEKVIKKEFNVNSDALLKINNSYGNIDVVTWNENRIEFEITITTNGNNEEKVQKRLDGIDVEFQSSSSEVYAKTHFKNNSRSWWSWSNNSNVNMKINYIVKIPITNSIDLNNDYGSINVGKLEGRAVINCDYGKITTKELMADNNRITFDYTHNSYFEYIKSGKINADYSDYTVGKTKSLQINADYTKSEIEIAEDVTYNCDYGSLKVNNVNSITGNGDYLTFRLGNVYKTISIKSDYGSIKIERLNKSFKNMDINSDYTGMKIGYDPALSFNYNIELEYSRLNGDDDWQNMKKRIESSSKYYKGYYGKQNSGNNIVIDSEYGGVTFYKN